jgi:hypothetical protein
VDESPLSTPTRIVLTCDLLQSPDALFRVPAVEIPHPHSNPPE